MDLSIDFLEKLRESIENQMKCPLQYLKDSAQILYYDVVCQLQPNSFEEQVTQSVMKLTVGEYKGIADLYEDITGDKDDLPSKKWIQKVKDAINGVNRKTNKTFGFQVFGTQGNTVSMFLPSQSIKAYR